MVRTLQELGSKGRKKACVCISLLFLFLLNLSAFGQAALPAIHDGPWQVLSDPTFKPGWSQSGLATDVPIDIATGAAGASANFNSGNSFVRVNFGSAPGSMTYYINAGNVLSGSLSGTFVVEESVDGSSWNIIKTWGAGGEELRGATGSVLQTQNLSNTSRFVRFKYANRVSPQSVRIDQVSISSNSGPEINIIQGGDIKASNSTYTFNPQNVKTASSAVTFTIENLGTGDLNLTANPYIAISGTDGNQFVINQSATSSPVASSNSTSFTVSFLPTSFGTKNAVLTILNNDADEGTYTINLTGNATILAPVITSFSPTSGIVNQEVTITGENLINTSGVAFNGVSSTSVTIDNDEQVRATVPAGASTGSLTVSTLGGTATGGIFTVISVPTISSINPTSGAISSQVVITGTNFTGTSAVSFNGTNATSFTVNNNTQITATVPTGATTGVITVTNAAGSATSGTFTVIAPPTISNINPTSGIVTTIVTITGTNFTDVSGVTFNGTTADFTPNSSTQITAQVPAGATTGAIAITAPGGTATSSTFTVIQAPTITNINPASGAIGSQVVITGTNFTGISAVSFNGTAATSFTVDSNTQITATVPANATTGAITVTNAAGSANSGTFTVLQAPTIISINPTSGQIGAEVTITGTNFTENALVFFNGTAVLDYIVDADNNTITALVPTGATTGTVTVQTENGTATGPTFTVIVPAPTISGINPTSGIVGTLVTITGTNLTNISGVTLNGTIADFTPNSSTQITAQVPAGATTGAFAITTPGGTATSSTFTVLYPPAISSFTPSSGPVGTEVTIIGSNFTSGSTVAFNGTAVSSPTFVSATQLKAIVPVGATDGTITVTTADGTVNSTTSFDVTASTTYTWNVTSGDWSDANSWTPARNTPTTSDTLIFNGTITPNATANLNFATAETIARLKFINNVQATLTVASDKTLNIDGSLAGADFVVQSGANVTITNSVADADLTLNITSGRTGTVAGTIQLQGTGTPAHRITATDTNSLTFTSGSTFITGANLSGSPFGSTNLNSVMFAAGSTYRNQGGASPFGAVIPDAVVTFNSGSTYSHEASTAPDLDGRTYGNFEINSTANQNIAGSNLTVNNLTLTGAASTTFNINLSGVININGNINVNSGTLGFVPASGNSIYLNGTSTAIAGSGILTLGTNANLIIPTGVTVDLYKDITGTGEVIVNGTVRTSDVDGFSGGANTSFTTDIITTLNTGSTVEYSGSGNQIISADDYANLTISRSNGVITFPNNILQVSESLTTPGTGNTYNFGTGTVVFDGSVQTIPALSFYNVTISGAPTDIKYIAGNVNIAGVITMAGGLLETGQYKVILGTSASLQETNETYIRGGVEVTRFIGLGGAETFGGIGAGMTSTGSVAPGNTTMYRITGEVVFGTPFSSIARQFFISADNNGVAGLQVTLTLGYWDHELNGNSEVNGLYMYKKRTTSNEWDIQNGSYTRDTGANTVTLPGVTSFSLWTLAEEPTVLPVSLVYFTAKRKGTTAELSWKTASEKDNKGFEVQVSEDAKNFRVLGFVASQNSNSVSPLTYSFTDREAGKQGIRYYRIRQVDLDGTETFYAPKAVHFDENQVAVKAYPNPFETEFEVQVDAAGANKIYLTVTNAIGANVYEKSVNARAGLNHIPVQLDQNLPAGVYILNIITDNKQQRLKVVKK